ncbi:MAG: PepSY domain-containing protein [Phyllobacterium sp.]
MLKKYLIIGAASLMTLTAVPQTYAQSIEIGPGGVRLREPERERMHRRDRDIDERRAVRIARSEGVRNVDNVRRTRSRYIVEGIDRRGNDIEVSIDRRSGEVLSVD